ncbi:DNA primase large subunit [Babesia duncani]|uniref:DNA primase large subunit n=1 Tax=Babesia duncani TaxID=323732 RepID=A0AAD9UNS2_9APIC|nr:DNA primase large subunit [Babesia duncani]
MSQLVYNSQDDLGMYLKCFYKGSRHVISCYNVAPQFGEINLRNFQEIAAKRLALLQYIDARSDIRLRAIHKDGDSKNENDKHAAIETKMEELGFILPDVVLDRDDMMENLGVAQADVISHFILRLASKYDWFVKNEVRLFELRMDRLKSIKIQEVQGEPKLETFLANNGVTYESKSPQMYSQKYKNSNSAIHEFYDLIRFVPDASKVDKVYIMPFYPDAVNLVRRRQVLVVKGNAYVPSTLLHVVASSVFRFGLIESLKILEQNSRNVDIFEDERISNFLKVLPSSYLGLLTIIETTIAVDYSQLGLIAGSRNECKLSLSNINKIYKITFPPCMRRLFEALHKNGHLKYFGRQQLWLFLKTPTSGHYHGCPFKDLGASNLAAMLKEHGLSEQQMAPIMDLKSTHQYQVACIEYFNQTSPPNANADEVGIHPNVFYTSRFKAHFSENANK